MSNESMIASCPKCGARYRMERARLRPEGVRLRCNRCEAVFRVTPPAAAAAPALEEVPAVPPSKPAAVSPSVAAPAPPVAVEAPTATPQRPAVEAPAATAQPQTERSGLVLVADADVEAGKALANTLVGWGLEALLVHDGVEAILSIQRALPRAVILDAGLPKMFGFQVCELVKRNESLKSIQVVLVGAIHHRDRYRREPSEIYGADAYVERPQLPEALRPALAGFGFELRGAPVVSPTPAAQPVAAPQPAPPEALEPPTAELPVPNLSEPEPAALHAPPLQPTPSVEPEPLCVVEPTPEPEPAAPASAQPLAAAPEPSVPEDPAVAAAERLARIIVSDVVLYNPERFEAGVRDGNVAVALEAEIEEGRSLFEQRVPAELRGGRDFLVEELLRVARSRGMTG